LLGLGCAQNDSERRILLASRRCRPRPSKARLAWPDRWLPIPVY